MGVDIFLRADNEEALWGAERDWNSYLDQYSLSRAFCNLIRYFKTSQPELNQLGQLAGVDVGSLQDMMTYPDEDKVTWQLEDAETEEKRQQPAAATEAARARLRGNIDQVEATIKGLLARLAGADDLPDHLNDGRRSRRDNAEYYAYFQREAAGERDHSYEQDLRTVQRYLAFARSHGSHTVYFEFG